MPIHEEVSATRFSCYRRVMLDEAGAETGATSVNCGVWVVAGRHRSYMTDFVRDARSGGCAAGSSQ